MSDNKQEVDASLLTESDEGQSSFLEFLITLTRHKRLVIGLPAVVCVLTTAISFLLPVWYTATTRIMPPQQSQSNAVAILGQLGALASGPSQALGFRNPSDIYVAMLKSRSVADSLIGRFDLQRIYADKFLSEARKDLAKQSSISAGREGIITIDVDDRDPKRAAAIANAYVEELRKLTLDLAVTEAGQRRLFFEQQVKKERLEVANAELELERFSDSTGLVNPQSQVGISIGAAAALRGQIAAKEVQLAAMRAFATDTNPDFQRTTQEISGLRSQLAKMEKNEAATKGDVMVPFGKATQVGLEYNRRYRDLKYHEVLLEALEKQYQIARIDEAKDATLIQVLDLAITPEHKSKPKRWLVVLISTALAALFAMVGARVLDALERASRDPIQSGRIRALLAAISYKRR